MTLWLSPALERALWQHAASAAPQEGVGFLGGVKGARTWQAQVFYPLVNVAADPERTYEAAARGVWQAWRALREHNLTLVGIYHSHPRGPAEYSASDVQRANYDVPYLIADLSSNTLRAYWLPEGTPCTLRRA